MNGLIDRKQMKSRVSFQVSRKAMKNPKKDKASSVSPEEGVDEETG